MEAQLQVKELVARARVAQKEFENYNQAVKTGIEVKSALSLYEGRDVAIVVRTPSINIIANNSTKVKPFFIIFSYSYINILTHLK